MKIALVILHADPARGGAERYTFDLAAALARRGDDVSLLATSFGPKPQGVQCINIDANAATRTGRYHAFLNGLDIHLASAGYDIVHAMLPVNRCDIYHPHAGVAVEAITNGHLKHATRLKRAMARIGNRLNIRRNAFARVERAMLQQSPGPLVVCLSEYVKETVKRHYALDEKRLPSLFNSVDLERFDPAKDVDERGRLRSQFHIDENELTGLMIAQDFARKGLAEAIAALRQAPGRLLVVGKEDAHEYQRQAQSLGLDDRVIFAGPTKNPRAFYQAADYFVLPTRHDPCSLVVLEALAMGLGVISTRQNGACEIMTPGVHGFVLDSTDDQTGLIAAITAMANPSQRFSMKQACLALRPKLSYEAHLNTLQKIYARVLQSGDQQPPADN